MDPASPGSPLDEGEIGDDESREFDDGYDENLMGDEEDKRKLAQMTEKEREQELFNRSERRETLKIRFEIERKLRTKAKKREQEKKQSKQVSARKRLKASEIYSSDESSDDSDEYSPETDSKSNNFEPGRKTGPKMTTRSALLSSSSSSASSASSPSSASDDSSESERENGDADADESRQGIQDDFQMTLSDLRALQLKREQIEKWVYSPFFRETAIGLFVKISVGNHPQTSLPMYKVAQIVDITKGRVERTYKMSFVSNRLFDEDDYIRWKDLLQQEGHDMPNREYFIRKKRDLHRAVNYEYKDEDIRYEVEERRRFKDHPYNFALKKTELMGEKADAEAQNDYEKARKIQQRIDELEEKARELEKTRSSSTFSAISFVNERNRYKNMVESERALKESKSVKTEDPFTRRKCTPTIVHNKNNGDSLNQKQSDKNVANLDPSQPSNTNASTNNSSNNNNKSKPEPVKSVDDLFQAHASIDLELDIDI